MAVKLPELPQEILWIIFDHFEDPDLSACLLTCKLWSEQVIHLQAVYQRKLQQRYLWGEYKLIPFPFMSEIFTPIYNARIMIISPRQAYLDWRRFSLEIV